MNSQYYGRPYLRNYRADLLQKQSVTPSEKRGYRIGYSLNILGLLKDRPSFDGIASIAGHTDHPHQTTAIDALVHFKDSHHDRILKVLHSIVESAKGNAADQHLLESALSAIAAVEPSEIHDYTSYRHNLAFIEYLKPQREQ